MASEEKGGSIDHTRLAQSDNSARSPDGPIVLLGDGDSSASETKVDYGSRAKGTEQDSGLLDSPENAVDSTTPAPPSPDRWHDIDDLPGTALRLRLVEQGALTSNSIRPYAPPPRLSSEPLYDSTGTEGFCTRRARSEAITSNSARPRSPPLCCFRASPENRFSQEGHLYTSRGVADKHGLVGPALDMLPINKGEREQEEVDEDNNKDKGTQQEVNDVAAAVTAERVGDPHLSGKEDRRPRSAKRQQSLPNRDPSPEPNQDAAGSDSRSDDELNTDLDDDDNEAHPMKRKRPSLSCDGLMRKKRKHRLQQRSICQRRPHSKPYRRSPKSHSLLDQGSTAAAVSSTEGRLPLPAPSTPRATDTDMSPDCCNFDRSSGAVLPMLTEVTFRPHSPDCCSFTAVVRDGCKGQGVSFSQAARLIKSIGHVGKIDDFTIKPLEQHSFLVTGFSRHTSSRPSSSAATLAIAAEAGRDHVDATRTRPQESKAVDARALESQKLSSDDDCRLSDSDSESCSDDNGCSSTSKHSLWSDLDEQRLLAYKKEDKSWDWIFKKFPGRTPAAVRTRWTMVQRRFK